MRGCSKTESNQTRMGTRIKGDTGSFEVFWTYVTHLYKTSHMSQIT